MNEQVGDGAEGIGGLFAIIGGVLPLNVGGADAPLGHVQRITGCLAGLFEACGRELAHRDPDLLSSAGDSCPDSEAFRAVGCYPQRQLRNNGVEYFDPSSLRWPKSNGMMRIFY